MNQNLSKEIGNVRKLFRIIFENVVNDAILSDSEADFHAIQSMATNCATVNQQPDNIISKLCH